MHTVPHLLALWVSHLAGRLLAVVRFTSALHGWFFPHLAVSIRNSLTAYGWFSARLLYLYYVLNGDTAVLQCVEFYEKNQRPGADAFDID